MRRFVVITLIAVMALTLAGAAWAAGGPPASLPVAAQERAQNFQNAMNQIKSNLQAMNQNRITIREMRGEIKGVAQQIREEIRRIREAGLPFSEEQLAEIKGVTTGMRGFGRSIAETMGQINEQAQLMRQARAELESGRVMTAYSRMQAVQEARLAHLESLTEAMNTVLERLRAIQ